MMLEVTFTNIGAVQISRGIQLGSEPAPWYVKVDGGTMFRGEYQEAERVYNRLVSEHKTGSLDFAL